ncbi:putative caffeoyl-CoA O-methyltransferase 1 isoform X2 [Glandiceps talaboti]
MGEFISFKTRLWNKSNKMSVVSSMLDDRSGVFVAGAVSIGTAVGCLAGYCLAARRTGAWRFIKALGKEDEKIAKYLIDHSLKEPAILTKLTKETFTNTTEGFMMVAPDQSQFFRILLKVLKAKKTIEVGTFTGYNALSMAMALPEDGKVIACDVNEEYTNIARRYWKAAGLEHKIDLRIQPALDTLDELIKAGESGTFDFIFIDADKTDYSDYYDRALKLVRKDGIVALDNVLWYGSVADPSDTRESTVAVRAINEKVYADDRVDMTMLLLGDGVTLAMKK